MRKYEVSLSSPNLRLYLEISDNPWLAVPQFVIFDVVKALHSSGYSGQIKALRFLRAAYRTEGEGWASLAESLWLYEQIVGEPCNKEYELEVLR